jgi:hypothetical protein
MTFQVRDRGKGYGTLQARPAAEMLFFWLSPLRDTGDHGNITKTGPVRTIY